MGEQINEILCLGQLIQIRGPADSALEQGGSSHAVWEDVNPETKKQKKKQLRGE
jgi:hypothetical protein